MDSKENTQSPSTTIERAVKELGGEIVIQKNSIIVFIDYDSAFHEKQAQLPVQLSKVLTDKGVDYVAPEYFSPKISREIVRLPIIGSYLSKIIWGGDKEYNEFIARGHVSRSICEIAKKGKKPIATMDIANNPIAYTLNMAIQSGYIPVKIATEIAGLFGRIYDLDPITLFATELLAVPIGLLPVLVKVYAMTKNIGIFDRDAISRFEKWVFDLEDARRVFIAKGLIKFDELFEESLAKPTLVYITPKAHRIRITNMLLEEGQESTQFRSKYRIYKATTIGINPTLEIWDTNEVGKDICTKKINL